MHRRKSSAPTGVAADRISVVISTYRQPAQLNACLSALSRGSVLPGEILIADDGSGPETEEVVGKWAEGLPIRVERCWHEDQGYWRTRAGNLAIARSTLDYVILLDCDCIPSRRWVEDHAGLAEEGCYVQGRRFQVKEPAVDAYMSGKAGLLKLALTGKLRNLKHAVRLPRPVVYYDRRLKLTIAANFAAWREDLVAVNGWNEEFRSYGTEDWELAARLLNLGRKRKLVRGRAAVAHLNHPLSPQNPELVERNLAILSDTVDSGRIRCDQGLDQHLGSRPPRT